VIPHSDLRAGVLALGMVCSLSPVAAPCAEPFGSAARLTLPRQQLSAAATASPDRKPDGETIPGQSVVLGSSPASSGTGLRGYIQGEAARTYGDPAHTSKLLTRAELSAQGRINPDVKWKLSARLDYDGVYDVTNFYPADVRRDQRFNLTARENYLDVAAGGWDLRLGRQHVVWGEIVGLFFADVVSAKDMREFLLPEFDVLRMPQWAARAEYSWGKYHAELLWIPVPTYDRIGKPGADFFPPPPPVPPGFATQYAGEATPARSLSNTNYGVRGSTLQNGWDLSAFYYRSMDASPTFYRQVVFAPAPAVVFEARHDRISQFGSTLGKDFGSVVLKAEAIYTRGRQFNVLRAADPDGVVPQTTLDWVTGLDFSFDGGTRLNLQLFQRVHFDHDPDLIPKRRESGYSAYVTRELTDNVEAQILWIASLDRKDRLLRPRVIWKPEQNWRLAAGVDIFQGPPLGFFGRFANRDRAYIEVRHSF
jgi:hypothetical protein